MSELDLLRRLGDQIVPPPFEALRETARRRARRARVATSLAVAASGGRGGCHRRVPRAGRPTAGSSRHPVPRRARDH